METIMHVDHHSFTHFTEIVPTLYSYHENLSFFVILLPIIFLTIHIYHKYWTTPIYLIDFMCFRGPESHRVPISSFLEHSETMEKFSREAVEFQRKVIERSGIGNETYFPSGLHMLPTDSSMKSTMEEAKMVLFSVVENLFTKHKVNPKSIDILITNCSINCPTPSLAAMIINRFGFRSNVRSYSLSGMGCSAGILSISLAKDLLRVHENSLALVLSTESICSAVYGGKIKSMLLPNCLFRMGGVAVLLSNKGSDKNTAKYKLQHIVRTHLGAKDAAYKCVIQETDDEGHTGVSLSRLVVQVAGEALMINMATLGSLVLPYSEQIKYVFSALRRKLHWPDHHLGKKKGPYIPDFKKAFDHFCIHTGGKAVIDAIKSNLNLSDANVEASKMTLYRFGNTSSSSTWYSLCYLEAKGRVNKGDMIWQLSFGSGFKCNSAVWKCISNGFKDKDSSEFNAWSDRIHRYPVDVPEVTDH